MAKTYKVRRFQNGKNKSGDPFVNYSITIPGHIAEALPNDVQFACELTEDGILFRPAQSDAEQVELPSWAAEQANGASAEAVKPKRTRSRPKANGETKASAKPKSGGRPRPTRKPKASASA